MKKSRKIQLHIVDKENKNADLLFWLSKSAEERIEAVEFLRMQYYAMEGYTDIPRFIPALRIMESHK